MKGKRKGNGKEKRGTGEVGEKKRMGRKDNLEGSSNEAMRDDERGRGLKGKERAGAGNWLECSRCVTRR